MEEPLPQNVVHIKIDSDHVTSDGVFGHVMLEQMIHADYENAKISRKVNGYGMLTDLWIEFHNVEDATHFRLKWQSDRKTK